MPVGISGVGEALQIGGHLVCFLPRQGGVGVFPPLHGPEDHAPKGLGVFDPARQKTGLELAARVPECWTLYAVPLGDGYPGLGSGAGVATCAAVFLKKGLALLNESLCAPGCGGCEAQDARKRKDEKRRGAPRPGPGCARVRRCGRWRRFFHRGSSGASTSGRSPTNAPMKARRSSFSAFVRFRGFMSGSRCGLGCPPLS